MASILRNRQSPLQGGIEIVVLEVITLARERAGKMKDIVDPIERVLESFGLGQIRNVNEVDARLRSLEP